MSKAEWRVGKAERKAARAEKRVVRRAARDEREMKKLEKEREERKEEEERRRLERVATVIWHRPALSRSEHARQHGESDDWGWPPSPETAAADRAFLHRRAAEWRLLVAVRRAVKAKEDRLGRGLSIVEVKEVEREVAQNL
jgi:hypothetical protein